MLDKIENIEKGTNILARLWKSGPVHQAFLVAIVTALICFSVAYLIRDAETKSYDQRIADYRFQVQDLKNQISVLKKDLEKAKESRFDDINRTAIFLENLKNGKTAELYKQKIKIDSL